MLIATVNPQATAIVHEGKTYDALVPGVFDVPTDVCAHLLAAVTVFTPATAEHEARANERKAPRRKS